MWSSTRMLLVLGFVVAACDPAQHGSDQLSNPLEVITSPVATWTFDDCVADTAWAYKVPGTQEDWVTMKPLPLESDGCAARLDFLKSGDAVGVDPAGVAGDGYGVSLRAQFPTPTEAFTDVTTTWTFTLISREDGNTDADKVYRYTLEGVLKGGELTLAAYGYRESIYDGKDLPRVEVTASAGSVHLDQWYTLTLVVDRTAGTLSLWVDGEKQGSTAFPYKTFDHIDTFTVLAEAWRPETYTVLEGEDGARYRPTTAYVDDIKLYAFDAAQLTALAP